MGSGPVSREATIPCLFLVTKKVCKQYIELFVVRAVALYCWKQA